MGSAPLLSSPILPQALALIVHRLPCFPCSTHKKPTTPEGFKNATSDPDILRELWRRYPGPLVGVPTGEASGLDVLDIDSRHGGGNWFAKYRCDLPQTRVHRTRRGGLHLLFHHQLGLRCSAGRIAPGVDVRASGGYVIWWPAAGYPVLAEVPPASWPEWLSAQLASPARPPTRRVRVPNDHSLRGLIRLLASARSGERNSLTFWAACRAGERVASGLLRADTAVEVIAEAASRAGLPFAEARRTAWRGIRAGGWLGHG